jgi:hypothetical protein
MRWNVRVACPPSPTSTTLGCIGYYDIAAAEGALALETQLASPAEDRAATAEGDGYDHEPLRTESMRLSLRRCVLFHVGWIVFDATYFLAAFIPCAAVGICCAAAGVGQNASIIW